MDTVAGEIQKNQKSLRLVTSCNPTGSTEGQILWMAIAVHLSKIDNMWYDFRNLDHDAWNLHLAYIILRNHPMFMFQMHSSPQVTKMESNDETYSKHTSEPCNEHATDIVAQNDITVSFSLKN